MSILTPRQEYKLSIEYIAGIFDGEGSITINRRVRNNRAVYAVYISISNSDIECLKAIQTTLNIGGSIHVSKGINQPIANLMFCNRVAIEFCNMVMPHAFIKKDQLQLGIDFYKECVGTLKGWGRSNQFEDRRLVYEKLCESYRSKNKKLKQKNFYKVK